MNKDKVLAALVNYRLSATEEQKKKDLEILEKNYTTSNDYLFENSVQIKDIEKYNSSMAKSIEDKLWFSQFLWQPQFEHAIIVDYGCSDGTLIKELAIRFPFEFMYFGVDENEEMLKLAEKNKLYRNYAYFSKNTPFLITNQPKILILSSVLHEVFSYTHILELYCTLNEFKPDYIFIRDMWVDESANRNITIDISKVKEHELFTEEFITTEKWRLFKEQRKKYKPNHKKLNEIELNWSSIIHFLLKYRYKENWEREVKEDYLSINKDRFDKVFSNYNVIYKKQYTLPFLKEQVMKDFGIDLNDNTHINLILKRKDNI